MMLDLFILLRLVRPPDKNAQLKFFFLNWFQHILFDQSLLHKNNIIEVGSDSKP